MQCLVGIAPCIVGVSVGVRVRAPLITRVGLRTPLITRVRVRAPLITRVRVRTPEPTPTILGVASGYRVHLGAMPSRHCTMYR